MTRKKMFMLICCSLICSCSKEVKKSSEEQKNGSSFVKDNRNLEGGKPMNIKKTKNGIKYIKEEDLKLSDAEIDDCLKEAQKAIQQLKIPDRIVPKISEKGEYLEVKYTEKPESGNDPGGGYDISVHLTKDGKVLRKMINH